MLWVQQKEPNYAVCEFDYHQKVLACTECDLSVFCQLSRKDYVVCEWVSYVLIWCSRKCWHALSGLIVVCIGQLWRKVYNWSVIGFWSSGRCWHVVSSVLVRFSIRFKWKKDQFAICEFHVSYIMTYSCLSFGLVLFWSFENDGKGCELCVW